MFAPESLRSANRGVPWSANSFSLVIVSRTWRSVAGNFYRPSSRSAPRSAVASAAIAAFRRKPVTLVRLRASGSSTRVAVAREAGELAVLEGEDVEHPVGLAQGRVGAIDHLAEVVAPGGEAGAEVVEDQPEAVAVGDALDVLDQVEVDGGAVVLQGQQALALAGLALGDLLQLGRRLLTRGAGLGRGAVDVALPDQRLRPDDAAGVLAEVLEPAVLDVEDGHRLAGLGVPASLEADDLVVARDVDGLHRADRRPRDPDLLVGDEEGAVVEDARGPRRCRRCRLRWPPAGRSGGRRRAALAAMARIRLMVRGARRSRHSRRASREHRRAGRGRAGS